MMYIVARFRTLSPHFRLWWLIFIAASLGDLVSTEIGLAAGGREGNPLAAVIFHLPIPLLSLLILTLGKLAPAGLLLYLHRHVPRAAAVFTAIVACIVVLLVLHNVFNLLYPLPLLSLMPF